jgi:hypothetical protein
MGISIETERPLMLTVLPGPTRKRAQSLYQYRLSFRNPQPGAVGCVMLWEVTGGRLPYQVALERRENGAIYWHCTCADAVYRSEPDPGHLCKHVRGLLPVMPPMVEMLRRRSA